MRPSTSRPPNVILIVIDALRARNLGCYGDGEEISPNIDRLASAGIRFENCFACWNTTDQSLTSILTGRYPRRHGIVHHGDKVTREDLVNFNRLNNRLLAELLRDKGYRTAAVDWMARWFKRGFEEYGYRPPRGLLKRLGYTLFTLPYVHVRYMLANVGYLRLYARRHKRGTASLWKGFKGVWSTFRFTFELARVQDAGLVTRLAEQAVSRWRDEPFFLFLHYWDTHTPYNSPKRFSPAGKTRRRSPEEVFTAKYRGAVSYVDSQIGRLSEFLRREGLLDNTLLIITSDHGESLTEHDIFFDHHGLYDVTTHTPLILHHPRLFPNPRKISALIQHVDLLPSLCELLGLDSQGASFDGRSFLPQIETSGEPLRPFVFCEESYVQRKIAIRDFTHKYMFAPDGEGMCQYCRRVHAGVEELYDLKKDPEESTSQVGNRPEQAAQLRADAESLMRELDKKRDRELQDSDSGQDPGPDSLDPKEERKIRKRLRSMGYLD
jgi:arylsulfatase